MESSSLDQFTFVSKIGKGSISKVSLVKRKIDNKLFALKVCKKNKDRHCFAEAVYAERDTLIALNHPAIVRLHSTFQTGNKLFFVLEYCPGGELFSLVQRKKGLDQQITKFYGAQVVDALGYLHSKGYIHRDLKLQNLVIDKKGYLRLIDFGLAMKENPAGAECGHLVGSEPCLPPEVIKAREYSKACDLWGLGVLLYQLRTGNSPFYAEHPQQTLLNIKTKEPQYPPWLSAQLRDLLQSLLQKDPALRMKSISDVMNHAWFSKVHWQNLRLQSFRAPFVPCLKNQFDVSCFDKFFTSQPFSPQQSFEGDFFFGFQYDKQSSSEAVSPPSPKLTLDDFEAEEEKKFELQSDQPEVII